MCIFLHILNHTLNKKQDGCVVSMNLIKPANRKGYISVLYLRKERTTHLLFLHFLYLDYSIHLDLCVTKIVWTCQFWLIQLCCFSYIDGGRVTSFLWLILWWLLFCTSWGCEPVKSNIHGKTTCLYMQNFELTAWYRYTLQLCTYIHMMINHCELTTFSH